MITLTIEAVSISGNNTGHQRCVSHVTSHNTMFLEYCYNKTILLLAFTPNHSHSKIKAKYHRDIIITSIQYLTRPWKKSSIWSSHSSIVTLITNQMSRCHMHLQNDPSSIFFLINNASSLELVFTKLLCYTSKCATCEWHVWYICNKCVVVLVHYTCNLYICNTL